MIITEVSVTGGITVDLHSTPDMPELKSVPHWEFIAKHFVHSLTPAAVGWNQLKPVGSSVVHITEMEEYGLLQHFPFRFQMVV